MSACGRAQIVASCVDRLDAWQSWVVQVAFVQRRMIPSICAGSWDGRGHAFESAKWRLSIELAHVQR
jgi:hypothetical protein